MRAELWEDLCTAGVKILLAVYDTGGEADFITVAYNARVGKATWYKTIEKLAKYGLTESVLVKDERGRQVRKVRLTPKGLRVAALLRNIEDELST